jgi:hypothetical protein
MGFHFHSGRRMKLNPFRFMLNKDICDWFFLAQKKKLMLANEKERISKTYGDEL